MKKHSFRRSVQKTVVVVAMVVKPVQTSESLKKKRKTKKVPLVEPSKGNNKVTDLSINSSLAH